ncbi:MAG: tRNA pseudouridine(55) synthase TruB [Mycoplasmataceae bacterium]|nr:tRNA pseudouridine(55) synthase TruB [Mycoplasmataceae bacterium]
MAFYLLDKQKGISSNKTLSMLKHEFNIKKAGFSGVLDPFATGLLIIATNGDTKFLNLFLHSKKTYTGTILFGKTTDTLDTEGKITMFLNNFSLDLNKIKNLIKKNFYGTIMQTPPKYSNIKVNGQRARNLVRENKKFELKKVKRTIFKFEVFNLRNNLLDFKVEVSSGTYIRSLALDLGKEMNIPSMLIELRRESIGEIIVPKETKLISREKIIKFKFIQENEGKIELFLNGKKVCLFETEENIIISNIKNILWIKKIEKNIYKIHKRIE